MNPAITVLKDNVPQGPFSRSEIAERMARGEYTPESLAFVEGLTQWTPLRDVLARVDLAHAGVPPIPAATMPMGTGFAPSPAATAHGAMPIGAGYSYAATMRPPDHLVYAGFWMRFAAVFVDGIITIPLSIPYYICLFTSKTSDSAGMRLAMIGGMLLSWLLMVLGRWLYFALQECSSAQATLGKRLLGIYVTDRTGSRIGFERATGRYFGKLLSGMILCIGFMMAGWTQRKQALHDLLADTLVVRRPGV